MVLGRGKQVDNLYRDLIAIGDLPLWSGLISQIGGMVMTGAAAIGLFEVAPDLRTVWRLG